ncbi:MAG TPA: hypothetical protein VHC70_06715 [Phycisphaerales bacterium]|nr:hypothetical protein [Phycisphaerales bacterium]
MGRVPSTVQDLLNYCSEHASHWSGIEASIGISAGDVTNLKNQADAAIAAVAAQLAAREGAKSATLTANAAVSTLRKTIATLVRTIVTFAEASADPMEVFAKAEVPPTAPATPSLPPGQPNTFSATLDDAGNITLKWKCTNPPGGNVVYNVMRRDDSTGSYAQVGVIGKREFTDKTIPAGLGSVQYQVFAFRGQMAGPASPVFTLQFGHGGGGSFASATPTLKVAA